jgi:hypothetical protein
MQTDRNEKQQPQTNSTEPSTQNRERQEQSDPQLTELRGFANSSEDLEPTLTDGTKVPDKADEENKANGYKE